MFGGLLMMGYLYLKLWDFLATAYYSHVPERVQANNLLDTATPYGLTFWWIEIVVGALVPAIIMLTPRLRRQDVWVVVAGLLAIVGIIVNRWNVTLSGLVVPMDWSPGAAELFPVREYVPAMSGMGRGDWRAGLRAAHVHAGAAVPSPVPEGVTGRTITKPLANDGS